MVLSIVAVNFHVYILSCVSAIFDNIIHEIRDLWFTSALQCHIGKYLDEQTREYESKICTEFDSSYNKANLRDLIAATGQVILSNLYSNHRFFSPCDLEI